MKISQEMKIKIREEDLERKTFTTIKRFRVFQIPSDTYICYVRTICQCFMDETLFPSLNSLVQKGYSPA